MKPRGLADAERDETPVAEALKKLEARYSPDAVSRGTALSC
jgi:hypothetical protein